MFDDGVSLNVVVGCSPLVEDGARRLVLTTVLRVSVRVVGCSPLVEDGGVGVGGAEGEDGAVAHERGSGGQLGGSLVVG